MHPKIRCTNRIPSIFWPWSANCHATNTDGTTGTVEIEASSKLNMLRQPAAASLLEVE
jgi:hypothetical protein